MKTRAPRPLEVTLLASVFVVAACGLVYELAAGALASYLLGDSILQFSTVIGCYLFAMGVGSWLSRFFDRQLPAHFLRIELLVALAGGFLPALLFLANAYTPGAFRFLLYALVGVVGTLVGLEIPLVMRILKREVVLKELVSQVLTFDYLGALAVSVAFPLLLVPQLGLIRTGLLFGLLNAAVAFWTLWVFRHELRQLAAHTWACVLTAAVLAGGFAVAEQITTLAEDKFYHDRIVLAATSPYQRIVVTNGHTGHKLFLNGNLQFAERDEYRYHEALVHPAMSAFGAPRRVAVLGGGDGMAVREILKYPSVESVTLVELDPNMTGLFSNDPAMSRLNAGSLRSPKLHIVNTDAFQWLQNGEDMSSDGPPQGAKDPSGAANHAKRGAWGHSILLMSLWWTSPTPPISRLASSTPTPFIPCWHNASLPAAMRSFRPHRPWWRAKVSGLWRPPSNRLGCAPRPTTRTCPVLASGATSLPATAPGICLPPCHLACAI